MTVPHMKTVYVYTGDGYVSAQNLWSTEPITGDVDWDEGGVHIRNAVHGPTGQVWQIPWSSVKYITYTEDE